MLGMAYTRLAFLVAMALALGGAAWAEDTPGSDVGVASPQYLQPSSDDGWIEGYLRQPKRRDTTVVAGIDSDRPSCLTTPRDLEWIEIRLARHGITLSFDKIGTSVRGLDVVVRPDGDGYLGSAAFPGCTVQLTIRKSVLRQGIWRAGRIALEANIRDWDAREMRWRYAMPPSIPQMHFFFEADRDECGWGSSYGILRGHVITAEIPTHGDLHSVRRLGSLTTNDWSLETAMCRYDLSTSFWTPDASGVLRPTPVSRLFAAVRLPPTP